MNVTKVTPISSYHHPEGEMTLELQDIDGIGERFAESFAAFLQEKKTAVVLDVLKDEFPGLAENENFVKQVVEKLDDSTIKEKRFVFLVFNPKHRR